MGILSTSVLVTYATYFGLTRDVAAAIADVLRENRLEVDILPAKDVRSIEAYTGIVLGSPLSVFRWHKDALRFLSRYRTKLTDRPTAVFALSQVYEPFDDQAWQDSRDRLEKALTKQPWFKPASLKLFYGMYDPSKLEYLINLLSGDRPTRGIRGREEICSWAEDLIPILSEGGCLFNSGG